jgi:hypothetical protein
VVVVLANRRSEAVVDIADNLAAALIPHYGWHLRDARRSGYAQSHR